MTNPQNHKVVYDCNIYLQYLLNPAGPSGRCVLLAMQGSVVLFVSADVLQELRELPEKSICIEQGISSEIVNAFIFELLDTALLISDVPKRFTHPIDDDDSCYVNLAIAVGAELIVSRDKHLLGLTNPDKPWALDFQKQYKSIRILKPEEFLYEYDSNPLR